MAWSSLTGALLVDPYGRPLDDRLQVVLCAMVPRLRRDFPIIRDDVLITDVLEQAGHSIVEHERKHGGVRSLRAYAWMTAKRAAIARLRRPSVRHQLSTFEQGGEPGALSKMAAVTGAAEVVERDIQVDEVLALMSSREHAIATRKLLGFTASEIGASLNMSAAAVDTMFCRAQRRVAELLRAATSPYDSTTRWRARQRRGRGRR